MKPTSRLLSFPRSASAAAAVAAALAAAFPAMSTSPALVAQDHAVQLGQLTTARFPESASACFVENVGQWDADASFRAKGAGITAWLAADRIALTMLSAAASRTLAGAQPDGPGIEHPLPTHATNAWIRFVGARRVVPEPVGDPSRARHHFVTGAPDGTLVQRTAEAWHSVRYESLWPGIDVVVRTSDGDRIAYDLDVEAGADLSAAVLSLDADGTLTIRNDGSLELTTDRGTLVQSAPVAWQLDARGAKQMRAVSFRRLGDRMVGFAVEDVDPSRALVIDPDLSWSSVLGGTASEFGRRIATMQTGAVLVGGDTTSTNFPRTIPGTTVLRDLYLACIDPGQPTSPLTWSLTLGGTGNDIFFDMALDGAGRAVIGGATDSITAFPTTPNALYPSFLGGVTDGFVVVVDPRSVVPTIDYATRLGGSGSDVLSTVEVSPTGDWIVGGYTDSLDLPTTANAYQTAFGGDRDAFVTRMTPSTTGPTIDYSTFLGNTDREGWFTPANWPRDYYQYGEFELDVDAQGRVVVAGRSWTALSTNRPDFPTTLSSYSPVASSRTDTFVSLLDPALPPRQQLVWSTFLGGSRGESPLAVRFGPDQEVVVAGYTYSGDPNAPPTFPTTAGAAQPTSGSPTGTFDDAFVTWFDLAASGPSQLMYSTFLGGGAYDAALALHVDSRGHATVGGFCSPGFPTSVGAFVTAAGFVGPQEPFVARLRPAGNGPSDLYYSTTFGAQGQTYALDVDDEGRATFCGATRSGSFPRTIGQPFAGDRDAQFGRLELLPHWTRTAGVERRGPSTPGCNGSVLLEVDRLPTPGSPIDLLVGNAPRNAGGVVVVGLGPFAGTLPVVGIQLGVLQPLASAALVSDHRGTASITLPISANFPTVGGIVVAQTVWIENSGCGTALAASATLEF